MPTVGPARLRSATLVRGSPALRRSWCCLHVRCRTSSCCCSRSTSPTAVQLHLDGFSTRRLAAPVRRAGHVRLARPQPEDRRDRHRSAPRCSARWSRSPWCRYRFRGRAATNLLIFLPMATPEVVMGSSLLDAVRQHCGIPLGFWTILIAHIMFCLSFVVVTVKARARRHGPAAGAGRAGPVRQPAADVPAGHPAAGRARHRWRARCWRSRCPSTTTSSPTSTPATPITFPMFVWGSAQRGMPAQVNVIGTAMFLIAVRARARPGELVRRTRTDASAAPDGRGPGTRPAPLADAEPRPVLAGRPGRPAPPTGARRSGRTATSLVVGGGYTGLWTALLAKERDPGARRRAASRPTGSAGPPPAATAASARPASPTASPTGCDRWPGELDRLERLGHARTSTRSRRPSRRYGIDCDFERTGELDVATEPYQVDGLREATPRTARLRPRRWSSWTATQVRAEVDSPTYLGGLRDRRRRRHGRTPRGSPGACARLRAASACGSTSTPGPPALAAHGAGAGGAHRPTARVLRPPGRAGHQRLPVAAAPGPAVHRAGLRLRADDRAARPPAQLRRRSAGATGRASATPPTSSTTTGSPPTTGSCGAATTRSTTSAAGSSAQLRAPARDLRASWPSTSSHASRSWRGCGSPTPGAGRSTPAPASARSSAPPAGGRVAYAAGFTGLGVGATRFGAEVMLDLLAGERHRADPAGDGAQQAAARSRPSRSRCGRHRLTQWSLARADAARAGATCGCAPWTGSASASTAEPYGVRDADCDARHVTWSPEPA